MARLHPLGRVGDRGRRWPRWWPSCCSPAASFVSGAVIPVDGGRAAQGQDPEETDTIVAWTPRPAATAPAAPRRSSTSPPTARTSPPVAATGCCTCSSRTPPPGIAIIETGAGSDDDLLAALADLLPADDRWRHRHGSPGHGRSHVMPALVPPYATVPVLGRPAGPRHLAERLPGRPERRQRRARGAAVVPAGLGARTRMGAHRNPDPQDEVADHRDRGGGEPDLAVDDQVEGQEERRRRWSGPPGSARPGRRGSRS